MSSILDALNKLEADKEQARRVEEERDLDPETAVYELLEESARTGPIALSDPRVVLGAAGIALIAVSVMVTVLFLRPAPPETPAPAIAAVPASANAKTAPPPIAPEAPETAAVVAEAVEETETEAESEAPVETPVQETPVPEKAEASPEPASIEIKLPPVVEPAKAEIESQVAESTPKDPGPEIVPERPAEPTRLARAETPIARPRPEPTPTQAPRLSSIRELPVLSPAMMSRVGIDRLFINMVSPASTTNPYDSAVINKTKIFVGDRIGTSRAKLTDVESYGIAVEIVGSGDRYFVPF